MNHIRMDPRGLLIAIFTILSFQKSVASHEYEVGKLKIFHPYIISVPTGAPVAGGYLTIVNSGREGDRLVDIRALSCGNAELHEMIMEGQLMRMKEVQGGISIPGGSTVELSPSGLHIMFRELRVQITPGVRCPVILYFEKAESIEVDFIVQERAKASMSQHNTMKH